MNDFGFVLKRDDNDYVININPDTFEGGYNVVPKTVDPYNAYEIADVAAYYNANPDKQVSLTDVENKQELESQLVYKEAELEEVNKQLFEMMCQDFSNRLQEVQTLPEIKNEVLSLMARKDTLMKEIASLEQEIEQVVNNN